MALSVFLTAASLASGRCKRFFLPQSCELAYCGQGQLSDSGNYPTMLAQYALGVTGPTVAGFYSDTTVS